MPGGDWQELKPSLLTSLRLPFALMRRSTLLSDCLQAFPRTPCRSSQGAAPSLAKGDSRCAVRLSGQETPEWHRRAEAVGGSGACGRGRVTQQEGAGGGSLPAGSRDSAAARRVCGLPGLPETAWASRVQVGPSGQTLPSHHSPWHFFPDARRSRPAALICFQRSHWPGAGGGIWPPSVIFFSMVPGLNPDPSYQSLK